MLPIKRVLLAIMMIASLFEMSKAQDLAVKTDLSSDIFTNINIGGEVGLAPKWTLDLSGEFNAWTFSDNKRWKHWFVQPEARYWFCDRFAGHFVGATEASTMSEALTWASPCSAPISANSKTTAFRDGLSAPVWPTAMLGCSDVIGTSKRR